MKKYYKELKKLADTINEYNCLVYEIRINHSNGYYFIDTYMQDGTFHGPMFFGDYNETKSFLKGLQYGYFFAKPF